MDLKSRKITFVQEFLRLENEKLIGKLEEILAQEKMELYEKSLKPMTKSEFNKQIDSSIADAEKGNVSDAKSFYKKTKKWR